MTLTRRLPLTASERKSALNAAKSKKDNPGSLGNVLSATTSARLDVLQPQYAAGMQAINNAQALLSGATAQKAIVFKEASIYVNHFLQVFNLGVRRGVYARAERTLFGLDVNSLALPKLKTEADIERYGSQILSGDPIRITAGGAPMANPSFAETAAKINAYLTLRTQYSNLRDNLDLAQEALAALNKPADKLIKRIWGEVESAFSEDLTPSLRAKAEQWGVRYVGVKKKKAV